MTSAFRTLALVLLAGTASAAQVEMRTAKWPNTDAGFEGINRRIIDFTNRNRLARKGVRCTSNGGLTSGHVRYLADGHGGEPREEGRATVAGQPSVITFYLGQPKPIHEVGVFTFNGDARANQDFEVRFADNSKQPGKTPTFPKEPHCTTGDKILGQNGGGWHTAFVAKGGGPLVPGKVDWVELRIWRTYNEPAGKPAKTKGAIGWTAVIELEVLGAPGDAIKLSAEEIARREAIRKAPKRPAYEKKATWQETMIAARKAIAEWEILHDRLAFADAGGTLGPWHLLGPLDPNGKEARELDRQRKLDLAKGGWRKLDGIRDGDVVDLAPMAKAKAGQVFFLARALEVAQQFERSNPFTLGLGLGEGWLRLLPSRQTVGDRGVPFSINQRSWELRVAPGSHQLLARFPVAADGTAKLWFLPQPTASNPGAGSVQTRIGRRERLFDQLLRDFADDPIAVQQMHWERGDSIWIKFRRHQMARIEKFLSDWLPGEPTFLAAQYSGAVETRLACLADDLTAESGGVRAKVDAWLTRFKAAETPKDISSARARYYALATVQEAVTEGHRLESMRLAIEDQRETFGKQYPKATEYLARVAALERQMQAAWAQPGDRTAVTAVLKLRSEVDQAAKDILLANPVLAFEKLLLVRGGPGFASNWGGPNRLGNEIVVLSPVRPDGEVKTIHRSGVSDMDLSPDATKILFSDGRYVHEVKVDGTGHRQISTQTDPHVRHYDTIYLPDGKIMFVSTACEQAVPCTGGWYVGNMHVMDADGSNERRLTFDQDHDWNPCVLNNGRVVYTRWEYTDTPHYFSRLLFHMNPDGTEQMEFYGSNSYWPNAMYWARPIPGHPTMISCVVSGHHGVARQGEMLLLDPARGRHEADGVIQRIPGRGKRVEPVIEDGLVSDSWPRFATPCPLAEPGTHRGAGKYFLATVRMTPQSPWGLYLVDVFDNMTPLLMGGYSSPTPLRPRPSPPVIPSKVDLARKDALVYLVNLFESGNLKGYPRGSIKALRIGTHHYRYGGNGDTRAASYEGGWDVKRILGTVPVHADGSAYFRIPANTPVFVQPIDAAGRAQQVMRSWFVGMPGELVSCVGCHETQNEVPPNRLADAMKQPPADIKPWHGPTRGFSFDREVQPVLDHKCAGCHDGQPRKDGKHLPDFRAKRLHKGYNGNYSPAYLNLARYVRRAGYEADYHLQRPAEWEATTSHLVQMLLKGHHNVALTAEEWDRLYAWIDFNVPYAANWRDSHRVPEDDQVARRAKYMKLYAGVDCKAEAEHPLPPIAPFEAPKPEPPRPAPVKLDGWPLSAEQAVKLQKTAGLSTLELDLGGGVAMAFVPVPAGQFVMGDAGGFPDERPEAVVAIGQPFYLGQIEVTNAQYALFDPRHDSAYIDARGKDRFTRGYPVNEPGQPAVRVTWHQAVAFCDWLSRKTGTRCTLPTEAEWEWACRAGTATPWAFGQKANNAANFADSSLSGWNYGRAEPGYSDGARWSVPGGRYKPNAWGLHDMHGNVFEWTRSAYRPYPYNASDGRNDPASNAPRVVRGGSWNDTLRFGRSASRWRYAPHRPVYNVGFRVLARPRKVARR